MWLRNLVGTALPVPRNVIVNCSIKSKANIRLYIFRSKLYNNLLRYEFMMHRQVRWFFGIFLFITGVLFVLQAFSFGDITGESIGNNIDSLAISDLIAVREPMFVYISFSVQSLKNQVQIVYSLDNRGENIRTDEFSAIVQPGRAERQGFRIALPENAQDELFVTVSVSDGASLAYERASVRESGKRDSKLVVPRSFVSLLGFILIGFFVMAYFVFHHTHRRRLHSLVHHAENHLTFRSSTSPL